MSAATPEPSQKSTTIKNSNNEIIPGPTKDIYIEMELHVKNETPDESGAELLEKVREWVHKQPAYIEKPEYWNIHLSDKHLYRFCRARQFKFDKICSMINDYFTWRNTHLPDRIRWRDVMDQCVTGKVRIADEPDRFGRPILILHNEYENSTDYPNMLKHTLWNIEKATRIMDASPDNISRYVIIMNMSNFSYSNQPPMSVAREVANALGNSYPERMGTVLILHAPWLFRAFYAALTVVLDKRTLAKVVFVKSDAADIEQIIGFFLGPDW